MFDVGVVGGGPAGCAAAITLARSGRSVVLLERQSGRPEGFCGEFLSPDGVGSLDRLGALDAVLSTGPPVVESWQVHGPERTLRGALPAPALGISRRALDPTLRAVAAAIGVEVCEGTHVLKIERADSSSFELISGDATWRARHVVGATGRSARVPGLSPPSAPETRDFVAFKAHFSGPAPGHEIRLFALGDAYAGVGSVEGDRVNVCYLARRQVFERAGSTPDAVLERATAGHPEWTRCWRGLERTSARWLSTGGLFFSLRSMPVRPGITLCGDAAGLISPFLGEGMSMALEGGSLAGSLVDRHLDEPETLAASYADIWQGRFGPRMRWGERLQRVLLSSRADAALRFTALVPGLARLVVRSSRSAPLAARGADALAQRSYHPECA